MYVGRVHKKKLLRLARRMRRVFNQFKGKIIKRIESTNDKGLRVYYFKTGAWSQLFGRARRLILTPKRSDTILRLTTRLKLSSDFLAGTLYQRTESRHGLLKRYIVTENMLTEKIGNFMTNRRFGGFRAQKDKQKIQKFNKDMEKEIKKQIRQEREKAKQMAKALKEEKAAKKKAKAKKR